MSERGQARQAEIAATAFEVVDQPENVVDQFAIGRIAFELHQFGIDDFQIFRGFREKIAQQIVHAANPDLSTC
ncbi:MAG TPA: hypothetical protein VGO84_07655, partial [Burkholderiales bacterium]|nr:hypothetical protein [Burkholderiales bacterium]